MKVPGVDILHLLYCTSIVNSLNVKIGFFTEVTNDREVDLVALTARFMNDSMLPQGQITFELISATMNHTNAVEASIKVCELIDAGIAGLVSDVKCGTSQLLDSQLSMYNIPHISITPPGCLQPERSNTRHTLFLRPQPHYLFDALTSVLDYADYHEVILIHDSSVATQLIIDFIESLSAKTVKTYAVNIVHKSKEKSQEDYIRDSLLRAAKAVHENKMFLVFADKELAKKIFKMAVEAGLNVTDNHWLLVNEDLCLTSVADGPAWMMANLLSLHYHYPGRAERYCALVDAFLLKVSEKYTVDGFLVIANAMVSAYKDGNLTDKTRMECFTPGVTPWSGGSAIRQKALELNLKGVTTDIFFDSEGYNGNLLFDITAINNEPVALAEEILMATWTPTNGLNITGKHLFPNTYSDFENVTIVIGTRVAKPFSMKKTVNNKTVWEGLCFDILNELGNRLNFRYEVVEPADGLYGGQTSDGNLNGLIGMLVREEIMMIVSPLTITAERSVIFDFTQPFLEDGVGILIKKPRNNPELWGVFRPLDYHVWAGTMIAILTVGTISYIINSLTPYRRTNSEKTPEKSLSNNLLHIYATYLEQAGEIEPYSTSSRVLVTFWSLFSVIIIATYTANLAAYLTVSITTLPIKTLEDLALSSIYLPIVKDGTNLISLFSGATPGTHYSAIWSKLKGADLPLEVPSALGMVRTGTYAFMTDNTQLEYAVAMNCDDFVTTGYVFNTAGLAFGVAKDKPYLNEISYNIVKMQEAGLIERWKTVWWRETASCSGSSGPSSSSQSLSITSVGGILLVVSIMAAVSLLVLALEFCLLKCLGKNREKKAPVDFINGSKVGYLETQH